MAGPSLESGSEAYREMHKSYKVLEAIIDRVLSMPRSPEVGSSNQASPSRSVGVAMASASEGVDIRVGVPLAKRNTLTKVKLIELRANYSVPNYVGLRLPSAADVVRYPLEGSVKWGPISKEQEEKVEKVRSLLSETERECKNLVTQKNLFESGLLQGMAGIIKGNTKVAVDLDDAEMQKQLRESRAQMAGKGVARQATGKRPRDDDKGRVAKFLGKKRALEEAHWSVMGTGPRLPPFDPQVPPKQPFSIEDVYAEGVEKMDFARLRRQKKEVNLAMHRQEVPLMNVFLEGVKCDPEVLERTPATSYADWAQKTFLTHAYAYGERYVNMAKVDKEIQRLKRHNEMAKDKIAEAQDAIREKNAFLLQKAALAREVEELKRSKAEEVTAARA
ncbi:unnamed protein product [Prunus armeniaca]